MNDSVVIKKGESEKDELSEGSNTNITIYYIAQAALIGGDLEHVLPPERPFCVLT